MPCAVFLYMLCEPILLVAILSGLYSCHLSVTILCCPFLGNLCVCIVVTVISHLCVCIVVVVTFVVTVISNHYVSVVTVVSHSCQLCCHCVL